MDLVGVGIMVGDIIVGAGVVIERAWTIAGLGTWSMIAVGLGL